MSGEKQLKVLDAQCELHGIRLLRNVRMADCTTLRLGGEADRFAEPGSEEDLLILLNAAREAELPVTIIGRGSNLLVLDDGVDGLVLRIAAGMKAVERESNRVTAQAGISLTRLAQWAAEQALEGLVFSSGIPGTLGGGTMMNAGAYGGELAQVIRLVEGYTLTGQPFCYTGEEMAFSHRYSRLMREKSVVTRVKLELKDGCTRLLTEEMQELNRRRVEKQPLTQPSAGSTFKRPSQGYASALIDQCGLKGCRIGGAQVSEKHAGFLLNLGGTSADFLALMDYVTRVVFEKTGIQLEPEVQIVGRTAE